MIHFTDGCVRNAATGALAQYEARLVAFTNDIENTAEKAKELGKSEMANVKNELFGVLRNELMPMLQAGVGSSVPVPGSAELLPIVRKLVDDSFWIKPSDLNFTDF